MVGRGPVRGPSHLCKRCNQGHRWHDSVVSVQLALVVRGAVLLIIRRSRVRAPPAPPAVSISDRRWPWTEVGGAIHPAVIAVRSHRVAVEQVWRVNAYGGKDWTGCLPGPPTVCGTEQCVFPPAGSPGMTRPERIPTSGSVKWARKRAAYGTGKGLIVPGPPQQERSPDLGSLRAARRQILAAASRRPPCPPVDHRHAPAPQG